MRADAAQGANGGGVVHTQAQHIFLALAALAALASAAMPAGALPGDDGDIALTVDGSVHSHHEEQVTVPAAAPVPAQGASHAVGVRVRAYDIVLPNPAGQAYRVVGPSVTGQVVGVDDEAVSVQFQERRLAVPWYYMMDDDAVRPYHALFWDTGTAWYLGLGHDVWRSFAGPVAPEASPFAVLAPMVPELRLRTGAEEIDIGAAVGVLLQSALQPASLPSFERPDAPAGEVGSASLPADDRIAAALGSAEAPAGSARGWAPVPAAAGPALPAQAVTHQSLAAVGSIEFAAGAMGFLAGLALYHLIRKSAILKNKVRSRIAEHVLHHPGSTITEIALAVGVTHQTASYHLRLLQQHGLVLGVERGNKRLYFRNEIGRAHV